MKQFTDLVELNLVSGYPFLAYLTICSVHRLFVLYFTFSYFFSQGVYFLIAQYFFDDDVSTYV